MTLIMYVKTAHGIVMSADRRILIPTQSQNEGNETITHYHVITDNEHKLFKTKNGIGISYHGDSYLTPMSAVIEQIIADLSPTATVNEVAEILKNHQAIPLNTGLFVCGYHESSPLMLYIKKDTKISGAENKKVILEASEPFRVSGDIDIVKLLKDLPFNHAFFTLQDGIDLLTLLNNTTSKLQHLSVSNQTVSYDCDILVITPYTSYWIEENKPHR